MTYVSWHLELGDFETQPELNTSEVSIMSVMSSEEKYTGERALKLCLQISNTVSLIQQNLQGWNSK